MPPEGEPDPPHSRSPNPANTTKEKPVKSTPTPSASGAREGSGNMRAGFPLPRCVRSACSPPPPAVSTYSFRVREFPVALAGGIQIDVFTLPRLLSGVFVLWKIGRKEMGDGGLGGPRAQQSKHRAWGAGGTGPERFIKFRSGFGGFLSPESYMKSHITQTLENF